MHFWWKVAEINCHLSPLYQGYTYYCQCSPWSPDWSRVLSWLSKILPPLFSILFWLQGSHHTEPMEIGLLFTSVPKVGISDSHFLFSTGYSGHDILPFHCSSIPQGLTILIRREWGRECLLLKALAWKWHISLPLTFHMTLCHLPNLIAREPRTYGRAGCPGKGGNGFEGNACSITTLF